MDLDTKLHNMTTLIHTTTPHGTSHQGTGFFYGVSAPTEPSGPKYQWVQIDIWVITNRHVVRPKLNGVEQDPQSITIHLRRHDKERGRMEWAPIKLSGDAIEERVRLHPDSRVDVAAIDASNLIGQEIEPPVAPFGYVGPFCLDRGHLLSHNQEIRIEVASDVLVVGYPRGFYDQVNLFPIVKSGIIASRWGARFQGGRCFLIDAKLFPGSSGSVVISKPIDMTIKDGRLITVKNDEKAFVLLGVFSGAPQAETKPVAVGDLTITQTLEYGLGVVWHAETIDEVLGERARTVGPSSEIGE